MDISTQRKIVAELYGCHEDQLVAMVYNRMTPQIRNSAIETLGIQRSVAKEIKETIYA